MCAGKSVCVENNNKFSVLRPVGLDFRILGGINQFLAKTWLLDFIAVEVS